METGLSLWALSANNYLAGDTSRVYEKERNGFRITLHSAADSLWIKVRWPDKTEMGFRAVYAPESDLEIIDSAEIEGSLRLRLKSYAGIYTVDIKFPHEPDLALRYTTAFTASLPTLIPYWPKDILVLNTNHPHIIKGKVHVSQEGARSGLIYFSTEKKGGAVFYMQDLTSLADYCQETETSVAGTVGGAWPELGFSLPVTKSKPLPAGREFIISDAYVLLNGETPANEVQQAKQFMDGISLVYRHLAQPQTKYLDYPGLVRKSIEDIKTNYGCWFQIGNKSYLNAYVCDYKTPPEIMVQLAALLPVYDYAHWIGGEVGLEEKLLDGLTEFYDPRLGTIMRWLPAAEDNLDKSEEQKREKIMDSWYLHHPLLNLSRLALRGNKKIEKLFLDSIEYAIRIAHHFNYQWPVFYNMVTLEVTKQETAPGKGGEKDVAGIYAAVMLQAWELTKNKRFLAEAEKAAHSMKRHGLWIFYQANTTAFSAKAMLKLYLVTKDEYYLDLSYLCIAGIMRNVHLWTCNYGYGRYYPSFFALYPLNDAPYTAAYEEQEVFAALHEYLQMAQEIDLLPSVSLLLAEFIRHFVNRAAYYFPPLLPSEMIATDVKMGEISPDLHLALEDLQDGWEKSGSVGQEVYGAGLAFGVAPRHYIRVPEKGFMIYIDYPVANNIRRTKSSIAFTVLGTDSFQARLLIIPEADQKVSGITVKREGKALKLNSSTEGWPEAAVNGNCRLQISW